MYQVEPMEDVEGALGIDAPLSPLLFQVSPVLDSSSPPSFKLMRIRPCECLSSLRQSSVSLRLL